MSLGTCEAWALEPGVVRSFTLATRARPGLHRIVHHYGDEYVDWPPGFFQGHVRVLAIHVTPAQLPLDGRSARRPPGARGADHQLHGRVAPGGIDPIDTPGKEANWIRTLPEIGWFPMIRLYGPLEPWIDGSWKPDDVEPTDPS